MGLSLVVLYAAVLIIRQIVEPKLVSKSIGIHPLAAVVSIYAGLRLIGIFGMIIGPFAALLVKSFLENRDENRGCVT
jgi:predicted PurR-regulated permease PerM